PLAVSVDLGDRIRLEAAEKYYLHVVATVGTIADREADEAGDAVFGKESDANGLSSFGRLLFRTAVKVSDYMQSVTTEIKGTVIAASNAAALANVAASVGLVAKRRAESTRVIRSERTTPTNIPSPASRNPWPSTSPMTSRLVAPSAIRTPISRRRCETMNART